MSEGINQNHFFEGPEKKLELVFRSGTENLLEKPQSFWDELVGLAKAKILSSLETDACKSFLLSESSLFVWKDRIILITCGTTTLIHAAKHLIDVFGKDSIEEVFYERKNEYQPSLQVTSALEDMKMLKEILGGTVLRFGRKDDHHVYVFNKHFGESNKGSKVNTLELLMYGLKGGGKDFFGNNKKAQQKALESLKSILPEFKFDPYFFEPEGFSFNALDGDRYATMHVTPQGSENYLSFEIDQVQLEEAKEVVKNLVKLCEPTSYDTILFSEKKDSFQVGLDDYELKQISKYKTESGYNILYSHFYDKENTYIEPFTI